MKIQGHWPCLLELIQNYFSAMEQCFPLTIFQHKHQHKPNFSETNRAWPTLANGQRHLVLRGLISTRCVATVMCGCSDMARLGLKAVGDDGKARRD